ncbi:MAG: hypothetical protein R2699_05510 [Acidimicrobiales bacterium]
MADRRALVALCCVVAGYGVHLVYTAFVLGWRGIAPGPARHRPQPAGRRTRRWLEQVGIDDVQVVEIAAVLATVGALGALSAGVVFGGPVAAAMGGLLAALTPLASYRRRRQQRRQASQDAWPRVVEEIRLLVGSVGRSIPQATLEAGRGGPAELRSAIDAAQREWSLTTDFPDADGDQTTACRRQHRHGLRDALIAHEVGGTDVDRRLAALAADRRADLEARKDARARLAGVRFARRFTLLVPLGMAAAGMAIGDGRAAYATPEGQVLVLCGLVATALCWFWAGRIMRLPAPPRVFIDDGAAP